MRHKLRSRDNFAMSVRFLGRAVEAMPTCYCENGRLSGDSIAWDTVLMSATQISALSYKRGLTKRGIPACSRSLVLDVIDARFMQGGALESSLTSVPRRFSRYAL